MDPSVIHYTACPACQSQKLSYALSVQDFTVSQKTFEVIGCDYCGLRFTQDVPDEQHIGVYYQSQDYISHTDSNKGFFNRIYHLVRRITMGDKKRLILNASGWEKGNLLDIGAGTGAFVQYMAKNGWQATGLEPDEATRSRATELYNVNLLPADALGSLPEASFHVITMWHVLEHVHDLHGYIEQLKKLLRPGGRLFIAVPNYTSYDARMYKGYWAAYDVPRHLYHFSPESVRQLLGSHGLQVLSIRPMRYDSFYISLLSEKYKKGSAVRGILIGLVSNIKAFVSKERCSSLIYIVSNP